jgi:hypothetical protein
VRALVCKDTGGNERVSCQVRLDVKKSECSQASSAPPTDLLLHAGKALKDIPAVVELFGLHTIKKADTNDPLKVFLSQLLPSREQSDNARVHDDTLG